MLSEEELLIGKMEHEEADREFNLATRNMDYEQIQRIIRDPHVRGSDSALTRRIKLLHRRLTSFSDLDFRGSVSPSRRSA